jgi:hypothetical protein
MVPAMAEPLGADVDTMIPGKGLPPTVPSEKVPVPPCVVLVLRADANPVTSAMTWECADGVKLSGLSVICAQRWVWALGAKVAGTLSRSDHGCRCDDGANVLGRLATVVFQSAGRNAGTPVMVDHA